MIRFAAYPVFQEIPESLESPIPTAAEIFQFLFQVPQWIQISGAVGGLLIVALLGRLVWRRRQGIRAWLESRSTAWRIVALILVLVGVGGASYAGAATWEYTQHANDFCAGCHVMDPAYDRFDDSEHGELECHDCHQQPISASMRQLVLWVLERPEEIGEHAPVDNSICVGCHITEDPDSTWAQVGGAAGHRIHMESDSTDLAEVACVTCHALEVHRFVPGEQTCGQSDCHSEDATEIVLGRMAASETTFHCVACHAFNAPVGETLPLTQAQEAMSPTADECFACHLSEGVEEIQDELHEGRCGFCHNPHEQALPETAQETCATADCHDDFFDVSSFHGLEAEHANDCRTCHTAHDWVAPTDCRACHETLS